MLPLLSLYGSLLGILGGAAVSLVMLDVSFVQYMAQTGASMGLSSLLGGLFKAFVYGSLVAVAGCQQGWPVAAAPWPSARRRHAPSSWHRSHHRQRRNSHRDLHHAGHLR